MGFPESPVDILLRCPDVTLQEARAYVIYDREGGIVGDPGDTLDLDPLQAVVNAGIYSSMYEAGEAVNRVIEQLSEHGDVDQEKP